MLAFFPAMFIAQDESGRDENMAAGKMRMAPVIRMQLEESQDPYPNPVIPSVGQKDVGLMAPLYA
ncbi:MAG: hypothetical protein APR55_09625 [Methanolinea sp. SDB]|nr:MAG: hypothetical protein APR55_09625 [Methanolinea sp. SDB]